MIAMKSLIGIKAAFMNFKASNPSFFAVLAIFASFFWVRIVAKTLEMMLMTSSRKRRKRMRGKRRMIMKRAMMMFTSR